MALPISVDSLIRQQVVENTRIDYKRDWNPESIVHSICAFANDIDNWGGGYIVIGIEEKNGMPKLPISGLKKSSIDTINKELLQCCNLIEPRYIPIVEQTQFEGKEIIVLWCPGGEARPYKAPVQVYAPKNTRREHAYYIRKMSNTIRANKLEEKELMLLANSIPYDDRMNYSAKVFDLKASLIQEFLSEVESELVQDSFSRSVEEIGTDMRIIGGPPELRKPLNVGLMFFNDKPDAFFPYARIEVVDKPDPTGEGMTEKIFTGPLNRQLKDALNYIKNYIIKEKISKSKNKAEANRIYNYPYPAVEEALSNAVYHKSYQIGEPITVMVTPDKMEITSLPGPDRTITDANLKKCRLVSKRYRNRRIGDFLKELKLIEGRNTGIPTMLRSLKNNGSGLPKFKTDKERSFFTVEIPVHKDFLPEGAKQKNNGIKNAAPSKRRTFEEIKKLIVETLAKEGSLPTSELVEKMNYKKLNSSIEKAISELMKERVVCYEEKKLKSKNQKLKLCFKRGVSKK
ncbi:MAG: putative DNA binding domain-containing protein [Treponema sp.]|nr:putative DNA binding domain-containing protein [Treponema sp.]